MNLSELVQPSGPMPTFAGQALAQGDMLEDFEIVQVLGLTSFGVLYLARNKTDGSTVAIKEYMPSSLAARGARGQIELNHPGHAEAYQRGLQAFIGEALSLSQFDHPNLLRVTSIWEANGTAYRSMPYMAGTTLLAHRARTGQPASQAELHTLLEGLLGALLALYHAGLAHGQVEPVNIYLLESGRPVLMDFDAVHQAVLSDLRRPYIDAYADPAKMQALVTADLHAMAALLHFAVSNDWTPPRPGQPKRYMPLADVLLRFKDSASVLGYQPEFLGAIDHALALPPAQRPGTVTEFRALFEPKPAAVAATPPKPVTSAPSAAPTQPPKPAERSIKREPIPPAPPAYPLTSSQSVLALLANFDRGPARAAEHVEPFVSPEVPLLTEEAEPALPPMRSSLFDDIEAGDSLPQDGVGYVPVGYKPMPRIPRNPWRRYTLVLGIAAVVLGGVGVIGWQLFYS